MSKVTVICYHYVRPIKGSRYPGIKGLEFEGFKSQMAYVKANYNIITIEQLMEAYDLKEPGKLPENPALLTFDDGYRDHFDYVFPVLDAMGVQGCFYIPGKVFAERKLLDVNKIHYILAGADVVTLVSELKELMDHYRGREFDYPSNDELWQEYAKPGTYDPAPVIFVKRMLQTVLPEELRSILATRLFKKYIGVDEEAFARELYVNREQIASMKKHGMHIGIHGYDHYWLGRLSKDKMEEDLKKALSVMEPFIDRKTWTMNYPYGLNGAWNDDVLAFIKKEGCTLGFTVSPQIADIQVHDRYLIPRIDTNEI